MRPALGRCDSAVDGLAHVGYLPENPYFYDYLSGREFLDFAARLFARRRRPHAVSASAELLRAVGLADAADGVHLRKYSKGMLQRVGIAQALVNDPSSCCSTSR